MLIFCTYSQSFAHRVNVFAWVEGEIVHTESYFQDGTAVHGGRIEVRDSGGEIVYSGVTDDEGMHSFKIPIVDTLTIVLQASMGHRATFEIPEREISLIDKPQQIRKNPSSASNGEEKGDSGKDDVSGLEQIHEPLQNFTEAGSVPVNSWHYPSIDEIREVIREEVSSQLKPLARQVAQLQKGERISTREIFAGIGYILGLFGLVMFFQRRKTQS
jgi:nickel transport protein